MDLYEFSKRKNKMVFSSWIIIASVLTIAYILELIKGNRDLYYIFQFIVFTWTPLIISYGVHLIIGRGNS